jgi:ribosomal protein S3
MLRDWKSRWFAGDKKYQDNLKTDVLLREFLDKHASTMPRTALRYAIEHMEKEERVKYLHVPRLSRT